MESVRQVGVELDLDGHAGALVAVSLRVASAALATDPHLHSASVSEAAPPERRWPATSSSQESRRPGWRYRGRAARGWRRSADARGPRRSSRRPGLRQTRRASPRQPLQRDYVIRMDSVFCNRAPQFPAVRPGGSPRWTAAWRRLRSTSSTISVERVRRRRGRMTAQALSVVERPQDASISPADTRRVRRHPPELGRPIVERKRLLATLAGARKRRVVLLLAPAGYRKTVVAAQSGGGGVIEVGNAYR